MLPIKRVVRSKSTVWRSTTFPFLEASSKRSSVSARIGGRTSSMKVFKLALLKKRSPAFLCIFHNSPSALMMPFPNSSQANHIPNRSQDLIRKNSPLMNMSLFFRTCSTFAGSLITMPGGRDGTDISKVLNPTSLSQRTNQSSSLCLGWRNQMPFPAKGRVPGGLGNRFPWRLIADLWP